MRYKFIREHRHKFSVQRMCHVLDVTRSGYYAWKPEELGPRAQENRSLVEHIHKEYMDSRQTYGSPRIWAALQRQGMACGRHRMARLMRRCAEKAFALNGGADGTLSPLSGKQVSSQHRTI